MKASRALKLSFAAAAAAAVLGFVTGCYYMPGSPAGNSKVALSVKGIPPNWVSTALVVTAPGMATISTTASPSAGSITVSVPAGPARTFTLLLNSPSATLQGVATVDLQPGETTQISVTPTLSATQIVIPDLYLNSRVVQISDISGTGWTTITGSSLSSAINPTGTSLTPYAIDFDSLGRIYIASQTTLGLFRIDDIFHASSATAVPVDTTLGITSAAVDRMNGLVYYGTGSTTINQKSVNSLTSNAVPFVLTAENANIFASAGLAGDDQGILYLAVDSLLTYTWAIIKYNPALPAGSRVLATSTYAFSSPWGVMAKGPYIYVSDSGAGKIVRLDKNLQFVDSFSGPPGDRIHRAGDIP